MDKEEFVEKAKEMAKESLQKSIPEAVASATLDVLTPAGYPTLISIRDVSEVSLFDRLEGMEKYLKDAGYQPNIKSFFKGRTEAQKDYVEGRVCPKCGSKLVYFEAKGKKNIKCSTQKWNFTTKKAEGCDYVEWADDNDLDSTSTPAKSNGATPAQERLLKEKNLWVAGMSKAEATQRIAEVLGK